MVAPVELGAWPETFFEGSAKALNKRLVGVIGESGAIGGNVDGCDDFENVGVLVDDVDEVGW